MAKAVAVVLVMVAALAMAIEAADHEKSAISLKIVLHNMAQGEVTLKLLTNAEPLQNYIAADIDMVPVVAQTGEWSAIGPLVVHVAAKAPVVHLRVTVKSGRLSPVKKMLAINLLKHFRYSDLKAGGASLVLTALESWRLKTGKYLVIKLGLREIVLAFKV